MNDSKPEIQKGNFIAFLNGTKQVDDNRPAFQGRLSLPGNPSERSVALWVYTAKNGQVLLNGKAGESAATQIEKLTKPPREVIEDASIKVAQNDNKGLVIDPHNVLLFTNKQKDAENPERPDYWGYYNPGGGERLMKVAVWAKTDRGGRAMLTGNLQRDEPNRSAEPAKDQDREPAEPPRAKACKREEDRVR